MGGLLAIFMLLCHHQREIERLAKRPRQPYLEPDRFLNLKERKLGGEEVSLFPREEDGC